MLQASTWANKETQRDIFDRHHWLIEYFLLRHQRFQGKSTEYCRRFGRQVPTIYANGCGSSEVWLQPKMRLDAARHFTSSKRLKRLAIA
jgi:hypothetical protein